MGITMEKQRAILESVIKEEIDFISYVDLEDGMVHTIVTNEDADVMPPIDGDYQKVNDVTIPKYVHPEDREMCEREFRLERLQENLQKKERFVINYRLLCGGEYRRKSMNIHYYDKTKMTLVFVRRDVTDNYEEEQNRQREIYDAMLAAKRADRSKSEFLERMSHEIRTPLNSIIGLSYLSRANLGDEKKVLENFDKIEMSAQFLRSCMDDILNLSLLESGRVAFHEESTDFEAFLTHIQKEFSDKAQEKKISFSVQRRGSFADQYLFDREKLNEALSAILENAVKYTQPEGSVFFIIELFTRGEQETIFRFEIRDNGIGMEQNFLPHIFDAFAQEDDRNTTLSGGTGLGLTISKNIIDFMGGKIDVYSEKGKGSAFVVTVPLKTAKEDRRRTERTTYQEYDFSGKRVLLVEDNEINIEITRNILIHKNFMVDIAENGKAGVEQFLKHEPGYYDVILMDIRMPVMDGLAATRCIRESDHSDSKTVPIVAMTANVFEEDVKKSFDAGMNAHLSKPVDIKQMYAVLDELVTGDGLL